MREENKDQKVSVRLVQELLGATIGTRLVQGVMKVLMVPMS